MKIIQNILEYAFEDKALHKGSASREKKVVDLLQKVV